MALAAVLLIALSIAAFVSAQYQTPAAAALQTIQELWFEPSQGAWTGGMGWWNMANTLETMSYFMIMTGKQQALLDDIQAVYINQPDSMILSAEYNDDVLWWSLAWSKAYQLTANAQYLARAQLCFQYVTESWDTTTCGGGVWWSRADNYKNAITNELFLMAATTLATLTGNDTYSTWAATEWAWFRDSGMINADWLVNDGLTSECVNNNETTWTYNQGVILGGLLHLYHQGGDLTFLQTATAIANATLHTLIYPNGVLREPCESGSCGADGSQFKGIFMRYLGYLTSSGALDPSFSSQFQSFIFLNALSNVNNNQATLESYTFYGVKWEGPYANDTNPAIDISSVLDCFNAAISLSP